MKRADFLKWWEARHTPQIKALYRGDPHGPACCAMHLCDMKEDGKRFWRRHREVLAASTMEEWIAKMAMADMKVGDGLAN